LWMLPALNLQAMSIVSFGSNDYLPGTGSEVLKFNVNGSATAGSTTRAFDATTPMNPSSFTGTDSAVFYGGYRWTNDQSVSRGLTRSEIRNNFAGTDPAIIAMSTTSTTFTGGAQSIHAVFLFQKADFLSGASTPNLSPVSLEASITGIHHSSGGNKGTPEARLLVRNGSDHYLSNTVLDWSTAGSTTEFSLDSTDLASETWASYDPTSSLNFDQTSTFSAVVLDDLTGVGIYFEDDMFDIVATGGQQFSIGLRSFTATAVPEPSAVAALLGLAAFGLVWRRRRAQAAN
jgi:hypothetical protein